VADRFLYLPAVGGAVTLATLAERMVSRRVVSRQAVLIVGSLLVASYAWLTYCTARHWRDNLSYWSWAVQRNPDAYSPNVQLANELRRRGRPREALPFYEKAQRLRPHYRMTLGAYLETLGTVHGADSVISWCNERLSNAPPLPATLHLYRGMAYQRLGQTDAAESDYRRALEIAADSPERQTAEQLLGKLGLVPGD
jgi:tetratricopeptide (TPR) repeat protein